MASLPRILLALSVLALPGTAWDAQTASAQTSAPVPAADAQAFLGDWALAIDAQGQTFTMDLGIEDSGGNVAAEVSSEMGPQPVKAERISKSGENLVLAFSIDAQGQVVPMVLTLTTTADGLNANVDFAAGMFVTTGKGTRK